MLSTLLVSTGLPDVARAHVSTSTQADVSTSIQAHVSTSTQAHAIELGVDDLRARITASPDDVDTRLRLAHALAWSGDRTGARAEALEVVARVPEYIEAHILLARIDAWTGRFGAARERLAQRILSVDPENSSALVLLADVELWSGCYDRAIAVLERLLEHEQTAELYHRLAEAEYARFDYLAAYLAARSALELDPTHPRAAALKSEIRVLSIDAAIELEQLPGQDLGHSAIVSGTVLPRNVLSLTLVDEYRRRFGTNNNRLAFQLDWRTTERVTLTFLGAIGAPANVIPKASGSARIASELAAWADAAIGYTFDRRSDDGALHRVRLDTGARVQDHVRLEAAYIFGLFADDLASDDLHAVEGRIAFEQSPLRAFASYSYGSELYHVTPVDPALNRVRAHNLGGQFEIEPSRAWTIRAAVEIQLRSNDTEVYRFIFGGRFWL